MEEDTYLPFFFDFVAYPAITNEALKKHINRKGVSIYRVLPPLPEQRAIANVLSSIDDKIDLLHRQNKTLEGMTESLWRKTFVEEADPGWKKEKLGDKMKPIDDKIVANSIQISTLSRLCNALLPKLMSGEVRMSDKSDRSDKSDFSDREEK
ncbi:MAG: hypothetical protein ABH870_03070 [bacterium]